MMWYEELGFKSNPLTIKPSKYNDELVGKEQMLNEILDKVDEGEIIFLKGDFGAGKSSLLKRIIKEYQNQGKLIYYSCNSTKTIVPFNNLLLGRSSFIKKILGFRAKEVILLLDEVQDLKKGDVERLINLYEQGFFKAVILSSKTNANFDEDLMDLIVNNIYSVGEITSDDAVRIVRNRIGELELVSDNMIKQIFFMNKNPRSFLENVEDVCRHAYNAEREKATSEDLIVVKKPELIKPKEVEKPSSFNTKQDVMNFLDKKGITYGKTYSKSRLVALAEKC